MDFLYRLISLDEYKSNFADLKSRYGKSFNTAYGVYKFSERKNLVLWKLKQLCTFTKESE